MSAQEAAIRDALSKIQHVAVSAGTGAVATAGRVVTRAAEEVVADFASTMENLFKSIGQISETLAVKLPSIDQAAVGQYLDRLKGIIGLVADWWNEATTRDRQFSAGIDWFHKD